MTDVLISNKSPFSNIKKSFEKRLQEEIPFFGDKTPLRDACEYALLNGGKRIRPLIVFLTADALKNDRDVMHAALSIEYFHTASLIADDLPCMDNDDFRRDSPSLHKVFGEATALLASYALINAAFEKIYESADRCREDSSLVLREVAQAAGICGTTGGQYLDLYPGKISFEKIQSIIEKKTIRLFEIAFFYGWFFGGGDKAVLHKVKQLGYHFGMAFQIADDLHDMRQDHKRKQPCNLALYLGLEKTVDFFDQELKFLKNLLEELGIKTSLFSSLKEQLELFAKEKSF